MANKSKQQIIAELETLSIGYDEKMNAGELAKILEEAKAKLEATPVAPTPEKKVFVGLTTIQDHEDRIARLEAEVLLLKIFKKGISE